MSSGWVYISFADDGGFRGGVIIQSPDHPGLACTEAHRRKINPGGQAMVLGIPDGKVPEEKWRNRLLTKAQVMEMWPDSKRLGDMEVGDVS